MSATEPSSEQEERPAAIRPLLRLGVKHWKRYALGLAALAGVDVINAIVLPKLKGMPFRDVETQGVSRTTLVWVTVVFVGAQLLQIPLRYLWRYFFTGTAQRIAYDVREDFFKKVQRLPLSYLDRAKTGDLMSRATNDMDSVRGALGLGALLAFDSLCYFTMVPILLVSLSLKLSLVLACCLPVVPVLTWKLGKVVHKRSTIVQDLFGKLSARLQETFSGIRVVQAFAQEEREAERVQKVGAEYLGAQLSLARVQSFFSPVLDWCFDVIAALMLLVGAREVLKGNLTVADLVTFSDALNQIIWPMMALGWLVNVIQRGAAAHARLEEIFHAPDDPTYAPLTGTEKVPAEAAVKGAIEARDLTFRYPGTAADRPPALEGVSFSVPAGALVAIVGPVGSGKSTLLNLVARLYEPPRGALFLDGRDILDVPVAALRRGVAIVPQETFLFSATIEENLKFGRQDELTRAQVEEAARAAQVDGEIKLVPGKYRALLGERGVNLSGGQRQRVAIARALVREPRVLLLDDALSAVDTATETAIEERVRKSTSDGVPPTRLVSTHRLAAARAADLVLVLEKGRLVERGSHAELVARGGLYARLARRDALEEEVARA